VYTWSDAFDLLYGVIVHDFDGGSLTGCKLPLGGFLNHDGLPGAVGDKTRPIPPRFFQGGIVIFASIEIVEGYGAEGIVPALIATDNSLAAIRVGHVQLQEQGGWTEANPQFSVAVAHAVVKAIAQQHAQYLFARLQLAGQVVG